MHIRQPIVYILTSGRNGTLYIGVTSDLVRRIWQHRNDSTEGFSKAYSTHMLVYFELHQTMESAILRKADEEVEAGLEVGADRKTQSLLARFIFGHSR